jgi:hypothetical protein
MFQPENDPTVHFASEYRSTDENVSKNPLERHATGDIFSTVASVPF